MRLDLTKDSSNRKAVKEIKQYYHCVNCGKPSGAYSEGKRKITRSLLHFNNGNVYQFCKKECKLNWIYREQAINRRNAELGLLVD